MNYSSYKFSKEALLGSLLLLIFACGEKSQEELPDFLFNHCKVCNSYPQDIALLDAPDSIRFVLPEEYGVIDPNIPPKKVGNAIYIKTKGEYLLKFPNKRRDGMYEPVFAVKLPDIHNRIADYHVVDDKLFHITSHSDSNILFLYDANTGKVEELMNDGEKRWNAMPYMGMTIQMWRGNYVLPFVPMEEYNKGRFLSAYNADFSLQESMGFGRDFKGKRFAPFFDTPIITSIQNDGTFYATYSSGEQVMKCRIRKDWTISYEDSICFPNSFKHRDVLTLSQQELADFEKMRKAHNCDVYAARLIETEQFVYRAVKLSQPEIDPETRKVRSPLDSPWILEQYSKSKGTFKAREFDDRESILACSIEQKSRSYFLTYESLEKNIVTFVAY